MMSKKLSDFVEKYANGSKGRSKGLTKEELEAVEKFAKEKRKLFEGVFDSPEKYQEAKKMLKEALK